MHSNAFHFDISCGQHYTYFDFSEFFTTSWVFQRFVALDKFLGETEGEGGGGWWAHLPTLASLGKMALGASVGFLGIGRSN